MRERFSLAPGVALCSLGQCAMSHILVIITTRSIEEAETLGRACVEQRLAASAQIEAITKSIYRFKGSVHSHEEARLSLFTKQATFDAIVAFIRQRHSYELPQIIALPIVRGLNEFLGWMDENTGKGEAEPT